MKKSKYISIIIFVITTILIILPVFFRDQLHQFRALGLLGLFFINFFGSATIFLPAPAIFSIPIWATIYNPLLVALVAAVGSTLGESTAFIFGHTSKEVILTHRKNRIFIFFNRIFKKYGGLLILVAAIIPNPFIDGIGIIAGLSSYPISKFLFYTFCGRLIRNTILAFFPSLIAHFQ